MKNTLHVKSIAFVLTLASCYGQDNSGQQVCSEGGPKTITENAMPRSMYLKFSGIIGENNDRHQVIHQDTDAEKTLAPRFITVTDEQTGKEKKIPKYADTVITTTASFDPAKDGNGNFMSSKFMPNNNCYNYGTNIATSSFAQPGRACGYFIKSPMNPNAAEQVFEYAQKDGLEAVGNTIDALYTFIPKNPKLGGHFVALMISAAFNQNDDVQWPGDFHWCRCNIEYKEGQQKGYYNSWSQKDGSDQITNFDFAGNPITDPSAANWVVNQGPLSSTQADLITPYVFKHFMFVPYNGKVKIL